jgi:AbrB family looped-hinge helix DNA binding protein
MWHTDLMARVRYTVMLGERGRIVLPADVRRALGVGRGDYLVLELTSDDGLRLRTAKSVARAGRGLLRRPGPSVDLAAELIEDRRAEAAREEATNAIER